MSHNKLQSYVGFAIKSGHWMMGYDTCVHGIKKKIVKLILITADASERTKIKFHKMTENAGIPFFLLPPSIDTQHWSRKREGKIFGITDENLAGAIAKEIESMSK